MHRTYRNSRRTWRITWGIGIFLLLLSLIFNHHLFFIYFYFYFVGLISLIYSQLKYADITDDSLIIYYGFFLNRKKIIILFSQIQKVKKIKYAKEVIQTVGARVRFTVKENVFIDAIELLLNCSLPKKQAGLKTNEIDIVSDGNKIILFRPPEGGFDEILPFINQMVTTKMSKRNSKIKLVIILDSGIVILSGILIIQNILQIIN